MKLINLVRMNIEHTNVKVKFEYTLFVENVNDNGFKTKRWHISHSVNIVLEKIIRESRLKQKRIKLGEVRIGLLAYANNIILLDEDVEDV